MRSGLLDHLPSGYVIAKDLSISSRLIPGNPYCRYDTDDESRKYCSRDLWENADQRYVIPEDSKIPREHIDCECCEQDSYVTDDEECGRCGMPIFECPNDGCDEEVHGKPDECPNCGVGYNWK